MEGQMRLGVECGSVLTACMRKSYISRVLQRRSLSHHPDSRGLHELDGLPQSTMSELPPRQRGNVDVTPEQEAEYDQTAGNWLRRCVGIMFLATRGRELKQVPKWQRELWTKHDQMELLVPKRHQAMARTLCIQAQLLSARRPLQTLGRVTFLVTAIMRSMNICKAVL